MLFFDIYNDWVMMNNWFNNFKNVNLFIWVIIFMKVKVDYYNYYIRMLVVMKYEIKLIRDICLYCYDWKISYW